VFSVSRNPASPVATWKLTGGVLTAAEKGAAASPDREITESLWLGPVERFLAALTERRIRRGSFRSVCELGPRRDLRAGVAARAEAEQGGQKEDVTRSGMNFQRPRAVRFLAGSFACVR
jgi:hypothetical protein